MSNTDPRLQALRFMIDSASEAINWIAREAFGSDHLPANDSRDVWHIREIADHLDETLGPWAVNTLVNATAIDRGADLAFAYAAKNPQLKAILPLKGMIKDLLKVGFSMAYRNQSFGDAVTDRALAKYSTVHLGGWMPEAKTLAAIAAVHALKNEHLEDE